MDVKAVLAAVDHATGQAGVVIDADGDVWLTGSLERVYGTMLEDHRPGQVGLEGERMLGGRLPRGAVSAEAVTDSGDRVACEVGDGAWVVVLDQPIQGLVSPVVFRNGAGVPVAAPLPEDWSRARSATATSRARRATPRRGMSSPRLMRLAGRGQTRGAGSPRR